MERPTLYLIDGYALIYRAYYAFIRNPLRTSSGEETSAPFGMARFFVKLLDERNPDYVGVVLDSSGPTERHEMYPEYKATREKMPEDLAIQIPRVEQLFEAFRVPVLEVPGQEADDVIGTLAKKAAAEGLDVFIVSGDKDFYQLVDERIRLLNPGRGGPGGVDEEVVDLEKAPEKFGVGPPLVPDVLGLMGDSSDNVPGVHGVGIKTARKLVTEWGAVEEIYANLEEAGTPKLRERLAEHREEAFLSKDLVTIRTDVDVELDLEDLKVSEPDAGKARTLFAELEFPELLKRFGGGPKVVEEADYRAVTTAGELDELVATLRDAGRFAFDVETTSLDAIEADLVGLSFATGPGKAWYVPVAHVEGPNVPLDVAIETLRPVLEDPDLGKIGQNVKYDLLVLGRHGVDVEGLEADAMLAAYLIDPSRRMYGLDVLALEFLGHRTMSYDEVVEADDGDGPLEFAEVPVERAVRYACEDADVTLRLADRFLEELEEKGLLELYRDVEMPLVPVLAAIEDAGVELDEAFFAAMAEKLEGELATLERECTIVAGEEFNLNSPQQLATILFEKLELPVVRRTKTGYSTDAEVLETLAPEHELPRKILEYRELAKLKSTYVDALPAAVSPTTGRLHSSFNQTVAASGRLSSSEPNLQNIPVRTPLGREIRKGFVTSGPGWRLLVSDYSQIELRILAHLSTDANLVEAFRSGHDIHRQTAALVFGVDPGDVTGDLRTRAKEVNFGVVYGMGPYGLARRLGITRTEAKNFIEGYFERFPDVKRFQEETIELAREQGYVTTMLGRRRYLPEIRSKNWNVRSFAERAAINSPIQGTAADLIKIAMIRIHERLAAEDLPARMLLTVHDELVFEVAADAVDALEDLVRSEMEGAIELDVPVVVETGVGSSWYEAK